MISIGIKNQFCSFDGTPDNLSSSFLWEGNFKYLLLKILVHLPLGDLFYI